VPISLHRAAAHDAIASKSAGRAAVAAIPAGALITLDPARCALRAPVAVRVSFVTLPPGFAVLAQ